MSVAQRSWREEGLHVTFSAGLGEWNLEAQEQLIMRVDEALYKAKQEGKTGLLSRIADHPLSATPVTTGFFILRKTATGFIICAISL